jgi:putative lipoic acid-binding regulatory protein
MAALEPERITFPADYPIKVVARPAPDLRQRLDAVFARHFGPLPAGTVTERSSAQSNFLALTYLIRVQDAGQLPVLHADLKAIEEVLMVL